MNAYFEHAIVRSEDPLNDITDDQLLVAAMVPDNDPDNADPIPSYDQLIQEP